MQMLDKGTAVRGVVEEVSNLPSKNPSWDSRWKVKFTDGFVFLVGNKGFTQQLERANLEPDEIVGSTLAFERTAEGFLNLVAANGKLKPGTNVVHDGTGAPASGKPAAEAKPKNPNRDFDPLLDEPDDLSHLDGQEGAAKAASEMARKVEEEKARKLVMARLEVEGDLEWAMGLAESRIRGLVGANPIVTALFNEDGEPVGTTTEYPHLDPAATRAIVALAATYHISTKDKLRGY